MEVSWGQVLAERNPSFAVRRFTDAELPGWHSPQIALRCARRCGSDQRSVAMYKRILLGYDGSESGQQALLDSREIAQWSQAELVLEIGKSTRLNSSHT